MPNVKWRLPKKEDDPPALFERNVGRARNEIRCDAARNLRQRLDGARRDSHPFRRERTTRATRP